LASLCGVLAFAGLVRADAGLAQAPRWEVDLSASRIRFDTLAALNAPSLSSLVQWDRRDVLARLDASVTALEGAGWSTQGRGHLAGWLTPAGSGSPVRLELAGTAAGSRHSSGFESWVTRADARMHVLGPGIGAWGGAGVAAARSSYDSVAVAGVVPTLGIWGQRGAVRATLGYTHTVLEGESYPEASLVLAMSRSALDLTAYAGLRRSSLDEPAFDEEWLGASGAYWVGANAAIVVSGGRYSADVLQGLPGGSFVSIGIRLTPRRARPIPAMTVAPIVYTVERVRSEGVTLRVPGARRVQIAGDWNGWELEPLERTASGEWRVPMDLEPGVYRFNLWVDGERWTVPEGVPVVEGGYGDEVGLLLISGGEGTDRRE
jgi:hypothetical protein